MTISTDTLLLTRKDVASLLTIEECIMAVESAFRSYGDGTALPPKVLGIHCEDGGFHIKAGMMGLASSYFVAKVNANFPGNHTKYDLPTIQGIIVVCDGINGRLLALIDSIEITILRTGAATAVAAKYLALPDASTMTICGCGNQGRISLAAIATVRPITKVFAYDIDEKKSAEFANLASAGIQIIQIGFEELAAALSQSAICVTCTPSRTPFIRKEYIKPGTFVAAVGADHEEKQELYPELLAASKIVADIAGQCIAMGEVHHAIDQKHISIETIHAELGLIVAGKRPGRENKDETIVFDSTGMALQDVAAAAIVYEKACSMNRGIKMDFTQLH